MAKSAMPVCKRCLDGPLRISDRLTLHKDDERGSTTLADLCRRCSRELEAWLAPPESVVAGWKAKRGQG